MHFPTKDEEIELHQRVINGDPVATADAFELLVECVRWNMQRQFRMSEEDSYDVAVDAIYAYLDAPERFAPRKARLSTYIRAIAKNRIIDTLRSKKRHERAHQRLMLLTDNDSPDEVADRLVLAREVREHVDAAVSSETDRELIRLISEGTRSTADFARVLGIEGLPPGEQQTTVKRHKDRLMKVLERIGRELA